MAAASRDDLDTQSDDWEAKPDMSNTNGQPTAGAINLTYLNGPGALPASGDKAQQLVVLLHGLGADGHDLIGLAAQLSKVLPDAAFIAPHGPEPCDMAPSGYQWFSLQDRSAEAMQAGVEAAAPKLDGFLDEVLGYLGLNERDTFLVGFSQGTMMALYTAFRRELPVAGVIGFSGAMIGGDTLKQDAKVKPPVLLVHGEDDQVVTFGAMQMAADMLKTADIPVQTVARQGLGHGIDAEGLMAAMQFIERHKPDGFDM